MNIPFSPTLYQKIYEATTQTTVADNTNTSIYIENDDTYTPMIAGMLLNMVENVSYAFH